MVLFSRFFLSSSVRSLFSFLSAFLTLWTKINFFVGRKIRTARKIDEIQYKTLYESKIYSLHLSDR